jgi:hypothetical protein
LGAFFAAHDAAKNRAFRGCAIAPAPALRAVAASHPSNPLRAHGLTAALHAAGASHLSNQKHQRSVRLSIPAPKERLR